ncbi:MAG: NUDIX hydrolase [Pseudomonadota bacterium]
MKRQKLIHLLTQYDAYGEEIVMKNDMLRFIEKNSDCFERSLEIGHLTGSSWLLNKDESNVLLMHHRKLDKWLQLGGHADGDSDILAVSIKEAQEESGITAIEPVVNRIFDIDIHKIPAYGDVKEHFHYDVRFLLKVVSDEEVTINSESNELRWIGKNRKELLSSEPSVVRMFDKWINIKV